MPTFKPNTGFKIESPYELDWTPIYTAKLEPGCLGKGNSNGTILLSEELHDEKDRESVTDHEKVHLDQIKRGDLDYDQENVYWKGKTYPRDEMEEGAPDLPWEKEAYKKTDNYETL